MSDILVFCLNPAVELSYQVPTFTQRLTTASLFAAVSGGKGTTVARHLHDVGRRVTLGRPSVTASFEGLQPWPVGERFVVPASPVTRPPRFSTVVSIHEHPDSLVVRHPGHPLDEHDAELLRDWTCELVSSVRPACVVMAGSLPPGALPSTFADIIARADAVAARTVIDTTGPPAHHALAARPTIVKLNADEASTLLQVDVDDRTAEAACRRLAESAEIGIVTLGGSGAWAASATTTHFAPPLPVECVCSAGAGDAFTAGIVDALMDGTSLPEMLERGARFGAHATTVHGSAALPADVRLREPADT